MEASKYRIVDTNTEWAADSLRGHFGHAVHWDSDPTEDAVHPAFSHEQMLECKRINDAMGERYGFDSYPHLVFDEGARTWSEVYDDDDVADILEPVTIDGIDLYFLGSWTGWAWGGIEDGFPYTEA